MAGRMRARGWGAATTGRSPIWFRGLWLCTGLSTVSGALGCGFETITIPGPPGFGEPTDGQSPWTSEDLRILVIAQESPERSEMIFVEGTSFPEVPVAIRESTRLFLTPNLGGVLNFASNRTVRHSIELFCKCMPRDDCDVFRMAPTWLWDGGPSWRQFGDQDQSTGGKLIREVCPAIEGPCEDLVRRNDNACRP